MRPWAAAAVAVLLALGSDAEPKTTRTAKRTEMWECLAAAREQSDDGVLGAYDRCVALAPDDGNIHLEIARAALRLKNLDRAAAEAQKTVESYFTLESRAAALYLLGRVAEQRGDVRGAVDDYRRSLAQRFDAIARARLAWLDHATELDIDPFTPAPLDGPFESIAAYCAARAQNGASCRACGRTLDQTAFRGRAPFRAATLFTSQCDDTPPKSDDVQVAVQLDAGWFVGTVGNVGGGSCSWDAPAWRSIYLAGSQSLVLRWSTHASCLSLAEERDQSDSFSAFVFAGLGPSGRPSLTPALTTEGHSVVEVPARRRRDRLQKSDLYLDLQLDEATWTIDATGGGGGIYRDDNGFLGHHVLRFP